MICWNIVFSKTQTHYWYRTGSVRPLPYIFFRGEGEGRLIGRLPKLPSWLYPCSPRSPASISPSSDRLSYAWTTHQVILRSRARRLKSSCILLLHFKNIVSPPRFVESSPPSPSIRRDGLNTHIISRSKNDRAIEIETIEQPLKTPHTPETRNSLPPFHTRVFVQYGVWKGDSALPGSPLEILCHGAFALPFQLVQLWQCGTSSRIANAALFSPTQSREREREHLHPHRLFPQTGGKCRLEVFHFVPRRGSLFGRPPLLLQEVEILLQGLGHVEFMDALLIELLTNNIWTYFKR